MKRTRKSDDRGYEEKRDALEKKLSAISPDQERKALGLSFRGILGKKGTLFAEVLEMAHVKDGAAIYDIREIPREAAPLFPWKCCRPSIRM